MQETTNTAVTLTEHPASGPVWGAMEPHDTPLDAAEEPEWFRQMANIVFDDIAPMEDRDGIDYVDEWERENAAAIETYGLCVGCHVDAVEARNGKAVGCDHCEECHSIERGCL